LVIVVTMIWLLIMATTLYLGWTDEKRKIIEWQWCAYSLWWELSNFVFYALTSKNLRSPDWEIVSPNYYIIQLTGWDTTECTEDNMCKDIKLLYSTWETSDMKEYRTVSISRACSHNNIPLKFYWKWDNADYIVMVKWFSQTSISDSKVFYIDKWWSKIFTWDIIIWLCLNSECSSPKEIWKFAVDSRPQSISVKNCKFYDTDDPTKCSEREL